MTIIAVMASVALFVCLAIQSMQLNSAVEQLDEANRSVLCAQNRIKFLESERESIRSVIADWIEHDDAKGK